MLGMQIARCGSCTAKLSKMLRISTSKVGATEPYPLHFSTCLPETEYWNRTSSKFGWQIAHTNINGLCKTDAKTAYAPRRAKIKITKTSNISYKISQALWWRAVLSIMGRKWDSSFWIRVKAAFDGGVTLQKHLPGISWVSWNIDEVDSSSQSHPLATSDNSRFL